MSSADQELQRNREVEAELALMGNLTISDPTGHSLTNDNDLSSHIPELVQALYTEDVAIQIQATRQFRQLLCDRPNLLREAIIKSRAVSRFVHFLEDSRYPEQLQFESARVLTNIARGTFAHTQAVIESGAVPVLIRLLTSSPSTTIIEQSLLALEKIASASTECRDLVLNSNALPSLLGLFNDNASLLLMRIATLTLRTLCSKNAPSNFAQVSQCLPVLSSLIWSEDADILVNVCLALSSLCDGPNEQIQIIIDSGVSPRAIQLLSHASTDVVKAALGLVCSIAMGDDSQTQVIINANALPALGSLLSHTMESIVAKACRTLANITAGNEQQIQVLIDGHLIPPLIALLHCEDIQIRKSAAWAIGNVTTNGSDAQIVYIVGAGAIQPLCNLLSETDSELIKVIISGLENVLRTNKDKRLYLEWKRNSGQAI